MKATTLSFWLCLGVVLLLGHTAWAAGAPLQGGDYGITTRESIGTNGIQADDWSSGGYVSADGRWVVFASSAATLVNGDTNNDYDVFLRDRLNNSTERISLNNAGEEANNGSYTRGISADGQWVLFGSGATNLVPGDTNGTDDLFLWERATRTVRRVSVSSSGGQGTGTSANPSAALSDDGRVMAFVTRLSGLVPGDTNGAADVFVHDRVTGLTTRVSVSSTGTQANNSSDWVDLSADGRYVTFYSFASNLVAGDTNGVSDVFVHDRQTGETERVSLMADGSETTGSAYNPALSGDGRVVAFATGQDLVTGESTAISSIYVYDRLSDTLTLAVQGEDGSRVQTDDPDLSHDGQRLFFTSVDGTLVPNDTNAVQDVFELEIPTGTLRRLSLNSYDEEGSIESYFSDSSSDGHFVVWSSQSPEFVAGDTNGVGDVFLRERRDTPFPTRTPTATLTATATATPRIPPYPNEQFLPLIVREKRLTDSLFLLNITAHGNGASYAPVTARHGGVAAFVSDADNLVPGDTNGQPDIFVWERATRHITRVSVSSTGAQVAGRSDRPAISEDGRYIVYTAWADGVVPEDTNGKADIYRYDRQTGQVVWVSVPVPGVGEAGDSVHADISADGNLVVFTSNGRNLNAGGTPGVPGGKLMGFVRNLTTNITTLLRYNGTGTIFQEAAWPSISDDGTKIGLAVWLTAGYCTGQPIARIDVETGATETIAATTVNHHWEWLPNAPRISPDGSRVGYRFYSNGEVTDAGYHLRVGGTDGYTLMTLPPPGKFCSYFSGNTQEISFSASNRQVVFTAADLQGHLPDIPGDTNGVNDIFLWDTVTQQALWLSKPAAGLANGHSYDAYISGDGHTVYFASDATNLVPGDTNGVADIFVWIGE